MRLTQLLGLNAPGKGRCPQPPDKTPFRAILPLRLKDKVSGKADKAIEGSCLQELQGVMACLQVNEYDNRFCQKEVTKFNDCYQKYLADRSVSKRAKEKGVLVPGEKTFTHKQLRKLLRKNPIV